jgi:Phage tail assembly chaperone protein
MQPYATFSTEGNPSGFYFKELHGDQIPADAIEISTEDYQVYSNDHGKWRRDPASGQRVATPPPPLSTREELLADIRAERNRRLAACDWTQNSSARLTADQLAIWNAYRSLLFDFPETCDPLDTIWPEKPE